MTDFVIDADDLYEPQELPVGTLRLDGREFKIHCPKDSLPIMLARLQRQMQESEDFTLGEDLVRRLLLTIFEPDEAEELLDAVIDPANTRMSLRFVMTLVARVQKEYAPHLDAHYAEMGVENPANTKPKPTGPGSRRNSSPRAARTPVKSAPKKTAGRAPKRV